MAEEEEGIVRPKRIFINNLDSYAARNIGKYLSACIAGASFEEIEEEAEEQEHLSEDEAVRKPKQGLFQIVGTLSSPPDRKLGFPVETYVISNRHELLSHLLESDVIIYNITGDPSQIDEASWAASALHTEIQNFESQKMFILISTVMTWARSKPMDPDDPEIPFTEDDYRRRKCHLNFTDHLNAEKLIIKLGKSVSKFTTYVIASGLLYGAEEGILHTLFKEAWLGETTALPVFGDGQNIIPLIHVTDLASVVQNIVDQRPRTHYLVAVDDAIHTQEEMVKAVGVHLGPGKVQKVSKEAVFLNKELTQIEIDHLLVNLRMEAVFLKENFNINWVSQNGIVENIESVVKEFKESQGLLPIRICILGPPAVGKTTVSKLLCKHYKLHHIHIKDVITEAIANLERLVKSPPEEEVEAEEGPESWQELLDSVKENMEQNGGRLDDSYVIKFMKEKLKSMPCQNQGYVLDGYPKTYEQAKELFNSEEGEEEEESRSKAPHFDKTITPEYVISLGASDEFLKNRVINLPESVVAGTHYTQERFLRALAMFRELNTEDETVLNYFDEAEIHPLHIDVSKDDDPLYRDVLKQITKAIGEPRNYGLTAEERAQLELQEAEESISQELKRKAELERREAEEEAERIGHLEEWNTRLEEVKRQEQELLEAQSVPLRNYLMKNVMPTLIQGINDCVKVRPDDPIDYLAEYLFKNNPEVQ
ncbi:PREDICTED: adenylate kinase 7 isoform X2 [Nanorana parkeri]|uniref:adenylate kinase 7 isoform X2 n=1 Tax=Nanorana parkeri TaxID=125878 RepID=UPI0008542F80|nr:PREDICTED: adenylate kinase 7 isoform X2 [Nanorana parkeri]